MPETISPKIATTRVTREVSDMLARVVKENGIGLITGPLGIGKRTATANALNSHPPQTVTVELPVAHSPRDLVRWLHDALALIRAENSFTTREIQDDVCDLLDDIRPAVVVTNCERLTRDSAAHLQWLHHRTQRSWPMILIGNQTTHRAIARDDLLLTSVTRTLECKPFDETELLEAVRAMHEKVTYSDRALLLAIDKAVCRGSLTYWALFIRNLEDILDNAGPEDNTPSVLTVDVAKQVAARMPSFASSRKQRP